MHVIYGVHGLFVTGLNMCYIIIQLNENYSFDKLGDKTHQKDFVRPLKNFIVNFYSVEELKLIYIYIYISNCE